jgi:hypothetical protein
LLKLFVSVLVRLSLSTKTLQKMRSLLYIIAVILVIGWIFGFFYGGAGSLIHVLLVIAVIAVILAVIRNA